MRGRFEDQGGLFSYISPEKRVPANHPLRKIRTLLREVLNELTHSLGRLYASEGRPAVPPEQSLSALLLQVFFRGRFRRSPRIGDRLSGESSVRGIKSGSVRGSGRMPPRIALPIFRLCRSAGVRRAAIRIDGDSYAPEPLAHSDKILAPTSKT
jgi:hypothetical protein